MRTVIDIAREVTSDALEDIVDDALERALFTVDEAVERLAEPDMVDHPGAALLRSVLGLGT